MKKLHKEFFILTVLVMLAGVLAFYMLGSRSLILDEMSTIRFTADWQTVRTIIWTQEGNMWLYYVVIYFWAKLFPGVLAIRAFSVICSLLSIPIFFVLAKRFVRVRTALLSCALLIPNLYFIYYAQQARSYALTLPLSLLSTFFFLRLTLKKSTKFDAIFYIFISLCSVYSYLLSGLVLLSQYIALLFFPNSKSIWKKMGIIAVAIWVGLLPLLFSPSFRGHQLDWLQRPPFVHLPFGFLVLSGDSIPLMFVFGAIVLFVFWKSRQMIMRMSFERFQLILLTLLAFFPFVFGFIFSFLIKPIYEPESFNTSLPAFLLLISIGLEKIWKRSSKSIVLILIVIFSLYAVRLSRWYGQVPSRQFVFDNVNTRDWKKTVELVAVEAQPTDAVIFYAYYFRSPFQYYATLPGSSFRANILEISSGSYDIGGGTLLPEPNTELLNSLASQYPRVWVILSDHKNTWLQRQAQWQEIEKSLLSRFTIVRRITQKDIEVELLERK